MGALRDDRDANAILMESGEDALRDMLEGAIKTTGKKKPKERTPEEKLKAVDELLRNGIEDEAAREEKRKAAGRLDGFSYYGDEPGETDKKPSEAPGKTDETPPNEDVTPRKERQKGLGKFKTTRCRDIELSFEDEWIIEDLLPGSGFGTVFGPPGCGKSFFALHLVLHAAAGIPYAGHATKKVRVVYVAAEGQAGFRKRVKAAEKALGLSNDIQFDLIEVAPNLGTGDDDLSPLIEAIQSGAEEGDEPVKIIVIDTLSRSLGGADENGPGMAKFIENCGVMSRQINDCLVLCVHHTGKDASRGMRGWSGLHGATDVEYEASRKGDIRSARMTKMKDGEDNLGWTFKLNQVEVGRNPKTDKPVTSCVVELLSDPAPVDADTASSGDSKSKVPRSLRVFGDAFNEAMIVHKRPISLTGAGAISTTVDAVDVDHVQAEFSKRWITGEAKDEDGKVKRRREQATWKAFKSIVKTLPPQYKTKTQNGVEYIWRLECKPH